MLVVETLLSMIRDLHRLSIASMVANIALLFGYFAVLSHEISTFTIAPSLQYFNRATFTIFFGAVTGSYEGIGTIIPIESSMREGRGNFIKLLHIALLAITVILGSFGVFGYLRFGSTVAQVIIDELAQDGLSTAIRCGLVIGVMMTFPMQLFPVIQIIEAALSRHRLRRGTLLGPASNHVLDPHSRSPPRPSS